MADSLGLQVPEQSPAPADSFLLDSRSTSKWIAALPMANIGETARQIFRTLIDFNRYQLSEVLRAKLVEQFREPVNYICNNLQRHYMHVGFPLSEKAWKTATLSRELNSELAISYKVIIEHMLAGNADRFDRKLLVIAIHRAMYHLGRSMLQTALIYAPWPSGTWKELNTLFAFAQQNQVHKVPVKNTVDEQESVTTIEEQYKSLLLLAAATPYRLRQHQIEQLYAEVRDWAGLTELAAADQIAPGKGRIAIHLLSDEPPLHTKLRAPVPGRQALILDTRPLLEKLQADFESAPWESTASVKKAPQVIAKPLLRQLVIALNQPPDRRFVRTRLNFQLDVVVGLQNIFQSAVDGLQEPAIEDPAASPGTPHNPSLDGALGSSRLSPYELSPDSQLGGLNSIDLSIAPLDAQPLSGESLLRESVLNVSSSLSEESAADVWSDNPDKKPKTQPSSTSVTTQNESAGGYCIRWTTGKNTPKVKVGELIGIASPSGHHQFTLGVVRWLRLHGGQELDLGLQIIGRAVEPVQLRLASKQTSRRSANAPIDCLLLPAVAEPTSHSASVIFSGSGFSAGTSLWLSHNGKDRLVRLTKLVEFNSTFVRYQFSIINDDQTETSGESEPRASFDDLWSSL